MGQRGTAVGKLRLDGCRVPASAMLGEPGQGYKIAKNALDTGRIGIAALAVGIARAAYEAAVEFAGGREQFGQKVSSFQGSRWMLVDMATDIEAARLLTHRAARLRDAGLGRHTTESAMAKLRASDVAMRVTVDALQVDGATGYSKSEPLERYVRDAKLTQIYEGPTRYNARSSPANSWAGHEGKREGGGRQALAGAREGDGRTQARHGRQGGDRHRGGVRDRTPDHRGPSWDRGRSPVGRSGRGRAGRQGPRV
jgi:Acyl-CoA dehydrogenase, C-terminal domain